MKKIKFIALIIVFSFIVPNISLAAELNPNFNPNYIISDSEILDYTSMTLSEIQELLVNRGSYLANYSCENPDGLAMKASEIIYDRAITNKINPKFLIVLLQKEQSLIESGSPRQSQLDWATGYGCPDSANCNERWRGFWKQVNSASLQFKDYINNPHLYKYKAGGTYVFTNPYSTIINTTTTVTPVNQATAALYNYTPHVYNGNYNFYIIWQRYFTRDYPDGSLLQAEGEVGVWLIQNGKKRPFLTKTSLTSRFDENKIITVNRSYLDSYPKGEAIKFPNYSLLRSPMGNIYLLVDDQRRGFVDGEAFKNIGYNPEEILSASWEDINAYKEGTPITATSKYPTGALLQDNKTGGVYWVNNDTKSPILDRAFLSTRFKNKKIIQVTAEELNKYQTTDPVKFKDGELLKSPSSPAVYLISNGEKRAFVSGKIFEGLGYKWGNVILTTPQVLYLYQTGSLIKDLN